MSKEKDEFEGVWIDINGFTAKEWEEIRNLAYKLRNTQAFKSDPFKCSIGAFVLWVAEGNGIFEEEEIIPEGTLFN